MRVPERSHRRLPNKQAFDSKASSLAPLVALAALVWLLELLDGVTAVVMMRDHGNSAELNPFVRGVFDAVGPLGVVLMKFGLASIVLASFVHLAHKRRTTLARNCLLVALGLAALGVASNLG